jgi:O-antigen/teichoic acid export membrane protein
MKSAESSLPGPESPAAAPESPPESGGDGLGARVRQAVIWRSGSQIVAQAITWGSTLIVIRLLEPGDYGLFAMGQVVLAFLSFLNGYGFASALIQSETVDKFRIRQAFGLLLLMNGGLAAMQLMAAPLVADYYNQPIIADILRVQALIFLSTPFIALPEVLMGRALEFRKQAIVNLTAAVIGAAIALYLAWQDYGVWTLVLAPIAMFWVRAIGLTWMARSLVVPSFDFRGCGTIVTFGTTILVTQLFWLVQTQSDILIAGRRLEPHAIGLYSESLFLAQIIMGKFVPPLNEVAFPAYAQLQKDADGLRHAFLKAARLVMLVVLPAYIGMAITAGPLVATLFGPKWMEIVPLVTLVALAMPFMTLQILYAPALNAIGRPDIPMRSAMAGAVIFFVAFFFASQSGIAMMAAVWLLAAPALLLVTMLFSRRLINVGLRDLAAALAPVGGAALMMGALVWSFDHWVVSGLGLWAPVHLMLLVAAGGLAYLGALKLFAPSLLDEAITQVRGPGKPASAAA